MTSTQAPPRRRRKYRPMPLRRLPDPVQETEMLKRFRRNNWFVHNQHTLDVLTAILKGGK